MSNKGSFMLDYCNCNFNFIKIKNAIFPFFSLLIILLSFLIVKNTYADIFISHTFKCGDFLGKWSALSYVELDAGYVNCKYKGVINLEQTRDLEDRLDSNYIDNNVVAVIKLNRTSMKGSSHHGNCDKELEYTWEGRCDNYGMYFVRKDFTVDGIMRNRNNKLFINLKGKLLFDSYHTAQLSIGVIKNKN